MISYDVLITGLQTGELMMAHLSERNEMCKYLEMEKMVNDLLVYTSGIVITKSLPDIGTFKANQPFDGLTDKETKELLHILSVGDIRMDVIYMLNLCRRIYADVMFRVQDNDNIILSKWKDGVAKILLNPSPQDAIAHQISQDPNITDSNIGLQQLDQFANGIEIKGNVIRVKK